VNVFQAVVLGIVEGVTEFLPVSSTGHLLVTEQLLGLEVGTDALTGFTAVIQVGAILAAVVYFRRDILQLAGAFLRGIGSRAGRRDAEFRFALAVVLGSIPIAIVGFVFKNVVKDLQSLLVVGIALIAFSPVMVYAERRAAQNRSERSLTLKDAAIIGGAQCIALIPGVSRSGATISTGLLRGLDRVSATRLSFLLGIPALVGAGAYQLKDATTGDASPAAVGLATVVAFVVAYASIAFLLKFVSTHRISAFVPYRVALGAVIVGAVVVARLT
jgi:undecaprenyl-diphosphatase